MVPTRPALVGSVVRLHRVRRCGRGRRGRDGPGKGASCVDHAPSFPFPPMPCHALTHFTPFLQPAPSTTDPCWQREVAAQARTRPLLRRRRAAPRFRACPSGGAFARATTSCYCPTRRGGPCTIGLAAGQRWRGPWSAPTGRPPLSSCTRCVWQRRASIDAPNTPHLSLTHAFLRSLPRRPGFGRTQSGRMRRRRRTQPMSGLAARGWLPGGTLPRWRRKRRRRSRMRRSGPARTGRRRHAWPAGSPRAPAASSAASRGAVPAPWRVRRLLTPPRLARPVAGTAVGTVRCPTGATTSGGARQRRGTRPLSPAPCCSAAAALWAWPTWATPAS